MMISPAEALRYLGHPGADRETVDRVARTARRMEAALTPRWVWRRFDLHPAGDGFLLGSTLRLTGQTAARHLCGCEAACLLACTLGLSFERELQRLQRTDMAEAACWDGCGSAYVEAGCEAAEAEIALRLPGLHLGRRFSPGYGDLPLTLQPVLLSLLDAERRLGLTLTDSLLMVPAKSVTAIIGLSAGPLPETASGCAVCALREDCAAHRT